MIFFLPTNAVYWWVLLAALFIVTLWLITLAARTTREALEDDDGPEDRGTGRVVGVFGAAVIWSGILLWLAIYALLIFHAVLIS